MCDVGGGQGHLLSSLLVKYPHLKGSVLELDTVIKNKESYGEENGVEDKLTWQEI